MKKQTTGDEEVNKKQENMKNKEASYFKNGRKCTCFCKLQRVFFNRYIRMTVLSPTVWSRVVALPLYVYWSSCIVSLQDCMMYTGLKHGQSR